MSQITFVVYDVMMSISSTYGFGRDMDEIINELGLQGGMEAITKAILYSAIGQSVLVVGTVLSKTSLALFLLHLVATRRSQIAIWVPDFFLATSVIASLFVFWFSCRPVAYLWDRRLDGQCTIDPGPIATYAGTWSVVLDLWYAAFPWFLLWKLNMPRKEKWLIAGSMSLGVLAAACGIKRAIELRNLGSPNYLQDVVGIIIWHAAELCTTMVCIGIPVCRPLYMRWLEGWISTKDSRESDSPGRGWLQEDHSASGSRHGVFGMHTIGGSRFGNQRTTRGRLAAESAYWRQDLGPSKERIVAVGASGSWATSGDTILQPDSGARDSKVQTEARIEVRTEFQVEESTVTMNVSKQPADNMGLAGLQEAHERGP
jgi:hypothetical protein